MNAEPDRELERFLGEAGEQWRARQPAPPDSDPSRLTGAHPSKGWVPFTAVAGIAAVLAIVVIPLALSRSAGPGFTPAAADPPTGTPAVTPHWAMPADQGRGVPVEGIGGLLREPDGTTKLCAGIAVTASLPPTGAGCSHVFVFVTGVDTKWFTESATSGQTWSGSVRVEGTYRGGTLAVNRVAAFTPDVGPQAETPVPCPAPAGGWRLGYGLPESDTESLNRLIEAVRSQPERFNDVWEGHPDGPPSALNSYAPTRMVFVVGTTGDLAPAQAELAAIYPGNLCVHKVRYTGADLEQIANRLKSVSATPIDASVDVIANKVRVTVVALDPATVAILEAIGREAMIIDEPLLRWLE